MGKKTTYLSDNDKPIVAAKLPPDAAIHVNPENHKGGTENYDDPRDCEHCRALVLSLPLIRADCGIRHLAGR